VKRRDLLPAVGLVAVAVVTAIAVVAFSSLGGGGSNTSPALAPDFDPGSAAPPGSGLRAQGIEARATLDPRITLFGDTIVAYVDVLLDRRKVDPESVRVGTQFLPWEAVGQPSRAREDAGSNTYLRTSYTLRCTGSPCAPSNTSGALEFDPVRVSYAAPAAKAGEREALSVHWPILLVYSRFAAANADRSATEDGSTQTLWRADLVSFPGATYRIAPAVLLPAIVVLAILLAAAGVALAVVAIPRRRKEPEPEPVIVLTPLEQALELLEDAGRADGTEDRRRALELVAEVLDLDHPELARAARTLAWSEDDPQVEQTSGLATRVRGTIDTNGNGRGH